MWTRRRIVIAAAAVVAVAGLVTGLLIALNRSQPVRTVSAPPAAQLRSPFTGEPVNKLNRVLAVKIDNIVNARPQTGINQADIVYVLPVEGGLSRFMAIFSSHFPPVVGPVRSAREDDIERSASSAGLPSPTPAPRPPCCPTFTGPPGSWTSTTA